MLGVRVDNELSEWIKNKANATDCSISDVIKNAILIYKKFEELPANMQFSELMLMQGAKSAMMAYRLLARFVAQTAKSGDEIVRTAFDFTNTEFEQFRIMPTNTGTQNATENTG